MFLMSIFIYYRCLTHVSVCPQVTLDALGEMYKERQPSCLDKFINLANACRNACEKFSFMQDKLGARVYMHELGSLFNFFAGNISVYNDVVQTVKPKR